MRIGVTKQTLARIITRKLRLRTHKNRLVKVYGFANDGTRHLVGTGVIKSDGRFEIIGGFVKRWWQYEKYELETMTLKRI